MNCRKYIGFLGFLLVFLTSCKSEMERSMQGKWYAAQLIECEEVIPIEREKVNLELMGGGKYVFNSTLNVHEEGSFEIKDSLLYTHDQIRENAQPKVVKIAYLAADTLQLLMKYKGKDQLLTLLREAPASKANIVAAPVQLVSDSSNKDSSGANLAASAATAATAIAATSSEKKEEKKPEPKKEEKKETKKESKKEEKKSSKKDSKKSKEKEKEKSKKKKK